MRIIEYNTKAWPERNDWTL